MNHVWLHVHPDEIDYRVDRVDSISIRLVVQGPVCGRCRALGFAYLSVSRRLRPHDDNPRYKPCPAATFAPRPRPPRLPPASAPEHIGNRIRLPCRVARLPAEQPDSVPAMLAAAGHNANAMPEAT